MKIAYLAGPELPSYTANSVHIMKMCNALSSVDHDVTLIGPSESKQYKRNVYDYYNVDESFEIIYIDKMDFGVVGFFMNSYLSTQKAFHVKPDLIYTRNDITAYLTSSKGLPTIYESHVPVYNDKLGRYRNMLFKRLLRKNDFLLLVVISESIKKYYEDNYRISSDNILLARDGADPINFDNTAINFSNNRELQVGYIGNLYRGRGKNVIKDLSKECDFAHFHIIGGKPKDIKIWKDDIISRNVTFHGFIPQYDLNKYYLGFDVLLAPYQKNLKTAAGRNTVKWMSPLKIFEYMAAGKPIIASDLPAIREILTHGETALLCTPDDSDDWIIALEKLRNPKMRNKLGIKGRNEFMNNYTWRKRAENIIEMACKKIR